MRVGLFGFQVICDIVFDYMKVEECSLDGMGRRTCKEIQRLSRLGLFGGSCG